jgi:cytochrome P450
VTDVLRRGVIVTDGEEHDHYRELMEPALHPGQLPGYIATMLRQTDRVTATWQNGQIVDMLVEGRKIALLIVMEALFSVDAWGDLPRIWTPILKAIDYISPGSWILWRQMPRPGYKKHLQALDKYLYEIIAARRAQDLQPTPSRQRPDLLQHLINAGLSDERIRDQMLTMLIAGHDTSTALLAWSFALLGQYPKTLAQLVLELDESLGQSAPQTPGGWQPHLLDEIIKEALRLYPPIHIGNRIAATEVTFGAGETIPAGARMFYSIYLTHRDPAIWENPDSRFARNASRMAGKPRRWRMCRLAAGHAPALGRPSARLKRG